jgi:tRNA/tmRNA/rRNA uracil-C5-methylase (TrmA/RlmC/RlmD family)
VNGPAPGDLLRLRIEKPVAGGRMLARADGAVVLVSGALPGEIVDARVERSQRGTLWARAAQVIEASPQRVGDPNPCGGCVLAHASYAHQLELKQSIVEDAFARVARLQVDPPKIHPSRPDGYRMRARLHVQGGQIGFYLEGSHTLCAPAPTGQLLPETLDVLERVSAMLTASSAVTAIELAENRDASERALHLELARDADPSRLGSIAGLAGITSLSLSHVQSPRVRVLSGEGRVTDHFVSEGQTWSISRTTQAFFQGNRYLLDGLVLHVIATLGRGTVTDLYAGAGLFAIAAAAHGRTPVTAIEGDGLSASDLRRNATEWRGLVQARHEPVEAYLRDRRTIRPQTLIVDPPRTGLSAGALQGVTALSVPRVVYVSCDAPTLARDVRSLVNGGYKLGQLTAFDLFPNTAHVETVAVLER